MIQPRVLLRGKRFHQRVQKAWSGSIAGAESRSEHGVSFPALGPRRRGRLDIFVEKNVDFVTVIEVKSTNWNRIIAKRRRPLLMSHRRQLERYVDRYVDGEGVSVCAAIVYPSAPASARVTAEIEAFWHAHGFQVVWYDA